jgi:hypothetical protein
VPLVGKPSAILIVAVALGALSGSAAHSAAPPTLNAIVGTNDGFNITLNDAAGKKVERLLPGTYTVVLDDRSTIHNFHLASNDDPTVDFRTDPSSSAGRASPSRSGTTPSTRTRASRTGR